MDVIYRFDPDSKPTSPPGTPDEATERLQRGNAEFVRLSDALAGTQGTSIIDVPPSWFDPSLSSGKIPKQKPFAAVLSCSDARVPTEIVFNQPRNQMFIVRVAGNVLCGECLGSIEYATSQLNENLQLVVVMGHGRCGAVTAAVDAFLDPGSYLDIAPSQGLRAIIDRIFVSVRSASRTLRNIWGPEIVERDGYRDALIDVTVAFNAALTAWALSNELPSPVRDRVGVTFGIFDLLTNQVWSPPVVGSWKVSLGLAVAPSDRDALHKLEASLGGSERVQRLLEG